MRDVFNLGVGMIAAVPECHLAAVRTAATAAGVDNRVLGLVRAGDRGVRFW